MKQFSSNGSTDRIEAIDVVRGLALVLIFCVHMLQRYLASLPPKGIFGRNPGTLNEMFVLVEALLSGKGFAIFSILFGVGMFMMMSGAERKGVDFKTRFLWRMAILFAIGYVHALFFRGDILTTYAILGIPLLLFRRASNRTIAITVGVLLSGVPKYVLYYAFQGEPWLAGSGPSASTAVNTAYHAAVTSGTLGDVFRSNAWGGHVWFFYIQLDMIGRAYLAFAYFLMGLWLGRIALFERLEHFTPLVKRIFFISAALAVPTMVVSFYAAMKLFAKGFAFNSWGTVFTMVGMSLTDTLIAITIFSGCLLAYRTSRGQRLFSVLAPSGRMPLTIYAAQSVVGTFLFYHWGLGLMGKVQNVHVALAAVVLVAVQIVLGAVWMRHFDKGPLEWLWRSATYLRWQPMLKEQPSGLSVQTPNVNPEVPYPGDATT